MIIKYIFVLLYICKHIIITNSQCPNNCNNQGVCNAANVYLCDCFTSYNISSDCSRRSCPYERAWSGKSVYSDSYPGDPHVYAECANRGKCNRLKGECECYPGYEGHACQRTSCNCKNGRCMTIREIYGQSNDSLTSSSYDGWESNHVTSCVCDWGYTGPACEFRMCPKGFDPLQSYDNFRTINITTYASDGYLGGYFTFSFNTFSFNFPANGNYWSSTECKASFESLPNIESVSCIQSDISDSGASQYQITFLEYSYLPHENNIYTNDGNPPLSSFKCSNSYITSGSNPLCTLSDVIALSVPEYVYCSNRGICDPSTGNCACYTSFSSPSCSSYTFGISSITSAINEDILSLENTNLNYYGNILHLITNYSAFSSYNAIKLKYQNDVIFKMNGVGDINMYYGSLNIIGGLSSNDGGLTIRHGGLAVTDGLTIQNDGLHVLNKGITINSGNLIIKNSGLVVDQDVYLSNSGAYITGGLSIQNNGMKVFSGGVIVSNNGMAILTNGLTVSSSGINVWNSGVIITGGLSINSKGVRINNAGLSLLSSNVYSTDGMSIYNNGMHITGGLYAYDSSSTMIVSQGVTVQDSGIVVSNGVTIISNGLVITGGVTIQSDGLNIETGGLTVSSGGVSILQGYLTAKGTLSIYNNGLAVAGVRASNGLISDAGIVTFDRGIAITNGLTISTGGLVSSGGVTLQNIGLVVSTGGLSIQNNGLTSDNGITVDNANILTSITSNNGLNINNQLSLTNNAITITSGGYIQYAGGNIQTQDDFVSYTNGVFVTGGVTIGGPTITSSILISGGLSIRNSGLYLSGGLTTTSATLSLNSLTVYDGLFVGGGITVSSMYANRMTLQYLSIFSTPPDSVSLMGATNLNYLTVGGAVLVTGGLTAGYFIISNGMTLNNVVSLSTSSVLGGFTVIGGVYLSTGLTINGGGTISGGTTILSGGLVVASGGLSLGGGLNTYGGVSQSGQLSILTSGVDINNGQLISGNSFSMSDGLIVSGGLSVMSGGCQITGGMTISSYGLICNSGLSVYDGLTTGNMSIDSITTLPTDLLVNSKGVIVSGDVTITNSGILSGLIVTDGVTILTGLAVTDGVTLYSNSFNIISGGLSISNGLVLTGGMSIYGTFTNSGGLTVLSHGLVAKNSQLLLSSTTGLVITGGLSIQNQALNIKDGMTIFDAGLWISNGLTVNGDVVLTVSPIIFSDRNLKTNVINITNSLDNIIKLRGVYFNWKNNTEIIDKSTRRVGLIAQEVKEIFPSIITSIENNKYLGVSYQQLIPIMAEAISELSEKLKIYINKINKQREMKVIIKQLHTRLAVVNNEFIKHYNIYNEIVNKMI